MKTETNKAPNTDDGRGMEKIEYAALSCDVFPPPGQLTQFGDNGWRVLQIIQREDELLVYFMRKVPCEEC